MKAIVFTQYGPPDVLQLKEIEKPMPKDDEVLIKVHAASVNAADCHLLRADPFLVRLMFGLLKPKIQILGVDIAGRLPRHQRRRARPAQSAGRGNSSSSRGD